MAIIECACGERASYDELKAQCPNDVITQCPGWSQDNDDNWVCPGCPNQETAKEKYDNSKRKSGLTKRGH